MNSLTKWISGVCGALGIWLMTSPFILGTPVLDRWNDVLVGGGIVTLSGYNYSQNWIQGGPSQRVSGILLLFGGWLLFAPFVIGVVGLPRWNDVIVGVLVTAFAGYSAYIAPFNGESATYTSPNEP